MIQRDTRQTSASTANITKAISNVKSTRQSGPGNQEKVQKQATHRRCNTCEGSFSAFACGDRITRANPFIPIRRCTFRI